MGTEWVLDLPTFASALSVMSSTHVVTLSLLFRDRHHSSASPSPQEGSSLLRAPCSGWQTLWATATEKLGLLASSRFFPLRGLRNRLERANTMPTRDLVEIMKPKRGKRAFKWLNHALSSLVLLILGPQRPRPLHRKLSPCPPRKRTLRPVFPLPGLYLPSVPTH